MTPERAVVLGATGFIGRHLVRRLASAGTAVTCPVVASRGRTERVPDEPGVTTVVLDGFDTPDLERCLAGEPAAVFNLAASGVDPADRDPVSLLDGNAGIVARLLAAARPCPPRIVVHAGSWSEYADPLDGEMLHEESPLRPRSVYGAAKAAAELYGAALAASFDIPS
jgi:UDP-glucose 4-epimerase